MLAAFRSGTGTSGWVAYRSWGHRMKACKVDEEKLAEWIDGATGAIRYLGPAVTERLAQKILAAEKRTGECNHVVIDLDDEMDRCGYGQTAGVRTLHDEGTCIHSRTGLRIAALSAPGIGVVWSPIAERVDPIDSVSVNGIWMEGPEQRELLYWISRMMGEPETSLSVPDIDPRDIPPLAPKRHTSPMSVSTKASTAESRMRPRKRRPGIPYLRGCSPEPCSD